MSYQCNACGRMTEGNCSCYSPQTSTPTGSTAFLQRIAALESELAAANEKLKMLRDDLWETAKVSGMRHSLLCKVTDEFASATNERDSLRAELAAAKAEIAEYADSENLMRQNIAQLHNLVAAKDAEIAEAKERIAFLERYGEAQYSGYKSVKDALTRERDSLRANNDRLMLERQSYLSTLAAKDAELSRWREVLPSLLADEPLSGGEHFHHVLCSADRRKPIGCDCCSCVNLPIFKRLRDARDAEIARLNQLYVDHLPPNVP